MPCHLCIFSFYFGTCRGFMLTDHCWPLLGKAFALCSCFLSTFVPLLISFVSFYFLTFLLFFFLIFFHFFPTTPLSCPLFQCRLVACIALAVFSCTATRAAYSGIVWASVVSLASFFDFLESNWSYIFSGIVFFYHFQRFMLTFERLCFTSF